MKTLQLGSMVLLLLLSVPPAFSHAAEAGREIRFQAGEMPLNTFLGSVSEKLGVSIDASGLGDEARVTIAVPELGALNEMRATALVISSLYLAGFAWMQDPATGFYRVARLRDARDQEIPVIADAAELPDSDLLVTYILRIQHTLPEFIARNLRSFMPANSRIIPDESTGTVLITDSAHNIAKLKKIVERLDTPEAAKQAKEWLEKRAEQSEAPCPPLPGTQASGPAAPVLIALFSMIALVIGFLVRGYVIRRIEGGL